MEKEDGGTTIVCETQETSELEQYFAWFTSDLYRLTPLIYADHVSAEDFISAHKNPLWADLHPLINAVEIRSYDEVLEHLEIYKHNTQNQLTYFNEGIQLLSSNDQAANFKQNIKKRLGEKEQEYFEDMFPNKKPEDLKNIFSSEESEDLEDMFLNKEPKDLEGIFFKEPSTTPTDWLQVRIAALNALRAKLKQKNIQEKTLSALEQIPPCATGLGCGIAAMTLFSVDWFIGAFALLVGSGTCLLASYPPEGCQDCKPINVCSNRHTIKDCLKNTVRLLHLSESRILNEAKIESSERDALLPKKRSYKFKYPTKGNGSVNSI